MYLGAAKNVPKKLEGKYHSILSEEDHRQLVKALANLDIKNLKDNYGDKQVTDLPSTDLEVKFINGNIKAINDYGNRGTPELEKFYGLINQFIESYNWEIQTP